jgi:hypothetical protein
MLRKDPKLFLLIFERRIKIGAESELTENGENRGKWKGGAEGGVCKRKHNGIEWNTIK